MTNPNTGKVPLTVYLPQPPEGMEWQIREPVPQREYYAGKMVNIEAVLRPIVSATVMVEMPRDIVEGMVASAEELELDRSPGDRMIAAFRAALARKPDAKPCPVMVHLLISGSRFAACIDESDKTRRPCKLTEGHEKDGSAHE